MGYLPEALQHRVEREIEHWARLYNQGHCQRSQAAAAMQELGADDAWIANELGPEEEEAHDTFTG